MKHFKVFSDELLYLHGSKEPALTDAGTEGRYLFLPEGPLHVLGPEGPCPALTRADVVHGATVVLKKDTVLMRITQVEVAQGCLGIVKMKLAG